MNKKKLNTDAIRNELAGSSAFFPRRTPPPATTPETPHATSQQPNVAQPEQPISRQGADSHQLETATPVVTKHPASEQSSMNASMLASYPDSIIEIIRKAVKHPGREVTFVRLTPEEKGRLADIVYTYKRQGMKTSENEISRIAICFVLEDYQANGQESILAKVIASLLA